MTFKEECLELFGSSNLYEAFRIKTTATSAQSNILNRVLINFLVKKAYYQMSILWHPDRFVTDEKQKQDLATKKFQLIGKIYSILSDEEKRAVYDDTEAADEDDYDKNVDWYKVWKKMFKKITPEDIEAYLKEYRGIIL